MTTALLKFAQPGNEGDAGHALFGIVGAVVTCSNGGDNTGAGRWVYTMVDVPTGSALSTGVRQDGPSPTWTFTPDVAYGYQVRLEVYAAGVDGALLAKSEKVFGVKDGNGRFIPPFAAQASHLDFETSPGVYNARGWATYLEEWLAAVGSGGGAVGEIEIPLALGKETTTVGSPGFSRIGGRIIDWSLYPATLNGLTREVRFIATLDSSSVEAVAWVDLYVGGSLVTGSAISNTAAADRTSPTEIVSGPLVVGTDPGMLLSTTETMARAYRVGGLEVDAITPSNARLRVRYV